LWLLSPELVSLIVTAKVREHFGEWEENGYGLLNYSIKDFLVFVFLTRMAQINSHMSHYKIL
jgi:hypothetical protein